jgi:pSer/pThr/pTyr-binding forkhead associated (FHA) protein
MPTLIAVSFGPDIPLDRPSTLIGRHPECDVLLDSLRVSRRHCIITAECDAVVLRDLGSMNGTWVNGRRVARSRLRPGDEVSIAHMHYYLGDAEAPTFHAAAVDRPARPDGESDSANSSDV